MVIAMIDRSTSVPTVDPEHLQSALRIVFPAAPEDDGADVLARSDVREALNEIVATLKVDAPRAVALFKRALALSAFCAGDTLDDTLFEAGRPGRVLCAAAAKALVIDLPGEDDGEIGHTLDAESMRELLKKSRN